MALLLFYLIGAVSLSFLCSFLEAVILSVTPAYVAVSIKKGQRSGQILRDLKKRVDQPLTAILTVNTIAHTMGAAGVGAQVVRIWGDEFLGLASALLTLVVLFVSEILPKIIAASNWKLVAPVCAYLIRWLIFVTYPFVLMSNGLSRILSSKKFTQVTREEMIETAELGALEGTIHKQESRVIKNLLMLDNIRVQDIMTPRSVMQAFKAEETVGLILETHKPIRFSRIPVFRSDLDNVIGMVHRYKIMEAASHDFDNLTMEKLLSPLHTVPEDISVSAVLDQFIKRKEHIFLVVDTYGSTAGLVTLEDAIETLLGVEIVDEFDSVADMRQYALEQWMQRKVKGRL